MLSVYIHIPFCKSKCPYCDFYSAPPQGEGARAQYERAVCARLFSYGEKYAHRAVGTVYFGGGTPSVFGVERLCAVLGAVKAAFDVRPDAEITAECNPADVDSAFFETLRAGGFNRISMGMQSANAEELRVLGRRHTAQDVRRAVQAARAAGFENVSVDLMLALPHSSCDTLARSVDFCAALGADHVSAYILKIEPGTWFASIADTLALPDEDGAADQYLFAARRLKSLGYAQYEISNFARPGKESRHNLQYWRSGEYLGVGPAAHSFVAGRRFFFPRDLASFLRGDEPVDDGPGGSFSEYAMLALRLAEGLSRAACARRFPDGAAQFDALFAKASRLPKNLFTAGNEKIALTAEGFLVSNAILTEILP
ncbi:MAG: radical SAM family heme chaperone HemW [Hominenteromicrobium sp.]